MAKDIKEKGGYVLSFRQMHEMVIKKVELGDALASVFAIYGFPRKLEDVCINRSIKDGLHPDLSLLTRNIEIIEDTYVIYPFRYE